MGVVYSAFDEELDRRVAIKVVRGIKSLNESSRQRMLREAKAMAKLSHPNVVQVYQAGLFDQGVFVAMEFIRGETLSEWLGLDDPVSTLEGKRGGGVTKPSAPVVTRPWREVVDMFVQAGRGLAAAHEVGLVHRDFKPDNVLVGEDGRARVLDFGLARVMDEEDEVEALGRSSLEQLREERRKETADLTKTGTIMGTPAYMSPEQHRGLPTDARTDQFSFCVSLHEGLFGERPFRSSTLMKLRVQVERGKIDPPSDTRDVPSAVLEVIRRGLAVEPDERFADMNSLLDELARAVEPPAWRRWMWPMVALLSVVVMAGAVLFAATREPTPEERSVVEQLVAQANEAGAHACWVVPCPEDHLDTSYRKVLELEGLEGTVAGEGDERAAALRDEFSRSLVRLGNRFWEREGGRGFARDYYLQALLFKEDRNALTRSGLTRGEIAEYREKARLGRFSEVERVAARPMQLLSIEDEAERVRALVAYRDAHGAALGSRAERLDALIVDMGGPPPKRRAPKEPPPAPVLEPEPEPTPPPEPSPPPEPRPRPEKKAKKPQPETGPSPADIEASRQLTTQGDAAKRRRQFKEAQTLYNRALDLYPRNHHALDGLCTVLFEQSDYGSAVVYCERAVDRAPGNARYHVHLGDAYYKTLRFSQARAQYLRAQQLGDPKASRKLDKVREKLGE
ncbi:MAG: protein kinase, partial [Myxococcales bacterium]|nr:protein kinase [Myxococcales bacterium]